MSKVNAPAQSADDIIAFSKKAYEQSGPAAAAVKAAAKHMTDAANAQNADDWANAVTDMLSACLASHH